MRGYVDRNGDDATTRRFPFDRDPSSICGRRKAHVDEACRQPAGWGTDHVGEGFCRLHGGNTPSVKKSLSVERLKKDAIAYGERANVNPYEALLSEVQWSAGHVEWLRAKVEDVRHEGDLLTAARPWLDLYRVERRHLAHVSKVAIDAGVAERMARIQEEQGRMLAAAVIVSVDRLGLSAARRSTLLRAIAIELRNRPPVDRAPA